MDLYLHIVTEHGEFEQWLDYAPESEEEIIEEIVEDANDVRLIQVKEIITDYNVSFSGVFTLEEALRINEGVAQLEKAYGPGSAEAFWKGEVLQLTDLLNRNFIEEGEYTLYSGFDKWNLIAAFIEGRDELQIGGQWVNLIGVPTLWEKLSENFASGYSSIGYFLIRGNWE